MATYIQKGDVIDYVNETDATIAAGTAVALTDRIGIAATEIEAGATGTLAVAGIFEMDKTDALVIALGAAVYYNATTGLITATETDTPAGWAVAASAAADTTVRVKIG